MRLMLTTVSATFCVCEARFTNSGATRCARVRPSADDEISLGCRLHPDEWAETVLGTNRRVQHNVIPYRLSIRAD